MPIPVTPEGKRKLQEELDALTARLPVLAKLIAEAREKGDLRENAEYHSAREEMSMTNARIAELKHILANAQVVDETQIDTSRIAFGAKVDLKDQRGQVETWYLVGQGEDDPLENRILTTSPMGQALLGKKVGDTVEVKAPIGLLRYTVVKISY
ncbi:MAG: transcription elongation factor GreA [Planctomycetota bacterium]|nr:transcription elongation factor GreA [Planctomycetota bacterium]MCX8039488.1 transcription elongation factor GreA [Planctomycetota bacterium]MDW8373006.1 transcription elongation factor GreA [Planctomycetota bacterium]